MKAETCGDVAKLKVAVGGFELWFVKLFYLNIYKILGPIEYYIECDR